MLAVATFTLWIMFFSYLTFRWKRTVPILQGQPVILLRDGKPLGRMLVYERLTLDDLKDAARDQVIKDLRQVALGVLQPDGKFSFIRADDQSPHQDEGPKS